jgi:hypothetical protein
VRLPMLEGIWPNGTPKFIPSHWAEAFADEVCKDETSLPSR